MRRNVFGAAVFSLIMMTGCIGGKTQTERAADVSAVRASQLNESEVIKATVGQDFEIKLKANPSTGYSWRMTNLDDELLKSTGESFVADSPNGVVGSGGTTIFNFMALKVGETELTLIYSRPWSSDVLESKIYKVVITGADNNDK